MRIVSSIIIVLVMIVLVEVAIVIIHCSGDGNNSHHHKVQVNLGTQDTVLRSPAQEKLKKLHITTIAAVQWLHNMWRQCKHGKPAKIWGSQS